MLDSQISRGRERRDRRDGDATREIVCQDEAPARDPVRDGPAQEEKHDRGDAEDRAPQPDLERAAANCEDLERQRDAVDEVAEDRDGLPEPEQAKVPVTKRLGDARKTHYRNRVAATSTTAPTTMTGNAGANTAADTRTSAPQTAPRPSATTIAARRRASGPSAPSALSSLTSAVSVPVTYVVDMVGASVRAVAAWMPIATPETAMSDAAARPSGRASVRIHPARNVAWSTHSMASARVACAGQIESRGVAPTSRAPASTPPA